MSAVSSTFKAHQSVDSEECAFSLSLKVLLLLLLFLYRPRLARDPFSGPELSPTHAITLTTPDGGVSERNGDLSIVA
jgi:hypothetical protein